MIRRIKLVNFMSHTNTVIEPADGLTILIGQNNCGKSAIVSALQILSGNATGDFMVRHGERECVIAVETDDGHVIEWRRKGGTVSYRINGRDVHRLQGSVPDELHGLLRLPEVRAEGGDFDIHFAEQKNPIFLLNETAGRRATFFASSSDAIKLIEMQNVHRRKIQDAKGLESDLVKREGKLNARIEALHSLVDIEKPLTELEDSHRAITDGVQSIEAVRNVRLEITQVADEYKKWKVKINALTTLTPPPVLTATKQLVDVINAVDNTAIDVLYGEEVCAFLRPLATPPVLPSLAPISELIVGLASTQMEFKFNTELRRLCTSLIVPPELPSTFALNGAIQDLQIAGASVQAFGDEIASLKTLSAPPVAFDTERLTNMIGTLAAAVRLVAGQRAITAVLAEVIEPPTYVDLQGLSVAIEQIVGTEQQVVNRELEVQQLREASAESEHDLRHLAEALDTCPICGQDFDPDRLVATAMLHVGEQP